MGEAGEYIEHRALVTAVDPEANTVTVRIENPDECGDCPAVKVCEKDGRQSNEVVITTENASHYHKDDYVTVRGTARMHRKAVMYATVYPCIILVATMVGIYLLTMNQLAAALSGIGLMLVFYLILWLCRDRIAHEFVFTITGKTEHPGEEK